MCGGGTKELIHVCGGRDQGNNLNNTSVLFILLQLMSAEERCKGLSSGCGQAQRMKVRLNNTGCTESPRSCQYQVI